MVIGKRLKAYKLCLYGRVGKFTKIKYGFSKFMESTQPSPSS